MAKEGVLTKKVRSDFSGGINYYLGVRQIKDNESPLAQNCDFKGKGGVGNRDGYTQIGDNTSYASGGYGSTEYQTSTIQQLIQFASNGSNVVLRYSTGGAWTAVTGTTFTNNLNMDTVQAASVAAAAMTTTDGTLFSFNGTDAMVKYDGTSWASHTGGAVLKYGAYFDNRLWGVDPTYKDTLKFSTKSPDATKPFDFTAAGTSSDKGSIIFQPGAGAEIIGIYVWRNALYVWTRTAIYSLVAASAANTFTVSLVTAAIGCLSFRSIRAVENDVYFAALDGVYSLGEVGSFTSIRAINKSLRIQTIFSVLSGTNKAKLAAVYHNYKYHLFYSVYGLSNDSCMVYDIRYQGWQDWQNIAANSATVYHDSSNNIDMYFIHPTNSKCYKMYSGTTDDGTTITSAWSSKSFDEGEPDLIKLYFDHTFVFGSLNGSVTIDIIFDDSIVSESATLTQRNPQGGFGNSTFGRSRFGGAVNTLTVSNVVNQPERIKAKDQKFAVQYRLTSTGSWRMDTIATTYIPMSHFKLPAANKLN